MILNIISHKNIFMPNVLFSETFLFYYLSVIHFLNLELGLLL